MRQNVLRTAVVVSLALCLAVAALWLRSSSNADEVQREVTEIAGPRNAGSIRTWRLGSHRGGVYLAQVVAEFSASFDTEPGRTVFWRHVSDTEESFPFYPLELTLECEGYEVPIRPDWRRVGFRWGTVEASSGSVAYVVVPHWILMVMLIALPLVRLARARRRRRLASQNCCPSCGYDLRATRERCPECGAARPEQTPGALGEVGQIGGQ